MKYAALLDTLYGWVIFSVGSHRNGAESHNWSEARENGMHLQNKFSGSWYSELRMRRKNPSSLSRQIPWEKKGEEWAEVPTTHGMRLKLFISS